MSFVRHVESTDQTEKIITLKLKIYLVLNVSLTTFLVCPLIIGTSVEERAPKRTFATPVRVTRPQSQEA